MDFRHDRCRTAGVSPPGDGSLRRRARGVIAATAALVLPIIPISFFSLSAVLDTPDVSGLRENNTVRASVLLAADGQPLTAFRTKHQEWVDLDAVSPHVVEALIATEDHRFYEHSGIDVKRTLSALFHTVTGDAQGGSTITQQLARNLFPKEIGRSRTVTRKLKEMATARRIEESYGKKEILEIYLNTVPFLYNVVGIEMAAQTYYGKQAKDLDALESATLVGMLKGTYYYNPVSYPQRAQQRRNVVLSQMVKRGMLPAEDFARLRAIPLRLKFNRPYDSLGPAPHFAEHARKWLQRWADRNGYDLYTDGLIVHTTLDLQMQEAATRAVERQAQALQSVADVEWSRKSDGLISTSTKPYQQRSKKAEPFAHFWRSRPDLLDAFIRESAEFKKAIENGKSKEEALAALKADEAFVNRLKTEKTRLQAGFVAMDPGSGAIKAWVGSRGFAEDQFDHVASAARQPGSTFKPFVYGAALEKGLLPYSVYYDMPVEIKLSNGEIWQPGDMSGMTGAPMTLRQGLIHSKNSITAQIMQQVGLDSIISLARAAGIEQSSLDAVPSLALGTSAVTLLEMVNAYSTIAALGQYRGSQFISRISDHQGNVLAEFIAPEHRAMSKETATELIDMMRGVVSQGTGWAVRAVFGITADIAGKTGTTQYNTDGWFILMHPDLVAGAWIGFNDQRVTMRSNHWGQGGHNAILLVGDFFRQTIKAKMINSKARFPQAAQPPIQILADDHTIILEGRGNAASEEPVEVHGEIVIYGKRISVGEDEQFISPRERLRRVDSPEELARLLRELGVRPRDE